MLVLLLQYINPCCCCILRAEHRSAVAHFSRFFSLFRREQVGTGDREICLCDHVGVSIKTRHGFAWSKGSEQGEVPGFAQQHQPGSWQLAQHLSVPMGICRCLHHSQFVHSLYLLYLHDTWIYFVALENICAGSHQSMGFPS